MRSRNFDVPANRGFASAVGLAPAATSSVVELALPNPHTVTPLAHTPSRPTPLNSHSTSTRGTDVDAVRAAVAAVEAAADRDPRWSRLWRMARTGGRTVLRFAKHADEQDGVASEADGAAEAASDDDDVSIDATIPRREAHTLRFPRNARAGGVGTGVGADGRPLEGAYGGRAFRTMQRRRGGRRGWRRPAVPVRSGSGVLAAGHEGGLGEDQLWGDGLGDGAWATDDGWTVDAWDGNVHGHHEQDLALLRALNLLAAEARPATRTFGVSRTSTDSADTHERPTSDTQAGAAARSTRHTRYARGTRLSQTARVEGTPRVARAEAATTENLRARAEEVVQRLLAEGVLQPARLAALADGGGVGSHVPAPLRAGRAHDMRSGHAGWSSALSVHEDVAALASLAAWRQDTARARKPSADTDMCDAAASPNGVCSVSTHGAEDKLQRDAVVHAHDESTATVGDAAWTPVHANAPAVGARATAGVAAATDTTTGSTTQPTTAAAHTGSSEDDTQERAGQSHEAAIAELLAALGRPVATGADGTPIALLL